MPANIDITCDNLSWKYLGAYPTVFFLSFSFLIQYNAFDNVVCNKSAILFRPQHVETQILSSCSIYKIDPVSRQEPGYD